MRREGRGRAGDGNMTARYGRGPTVCRAPSSSARIARAIRETGSRPRGFGRGVRILRRGCGHLVNLYEPGPLEGAARAMARSCDLQGAGSPPGRNRGRSRGGAATALSRLLRRDVGRALAADARRGPRFRSLRRVLRPPSGRRPRSAGRRRPTRRRRHLPLHAQRPGAQGRRLLHGRRIRYRADAGCPAGGRTRARTRPLLHPQGLSHQAGHDAALVARRHALCRALLHRSDVRLRLAAGHRSRQLACRCPICIISTACRRRFACARGPSSMST